MKTITIYNEIRLQPRNMEKSHNRHLATSSHNGSLWLLPHADVLGMAASLICMIHCLAMPFVLTLAPSLAPGLVHDERTHYFLAMFVTAFCLFGILPGYVRHNRKNVLYTMLAGLTLVLFATFVVGYTFGERFEIPIITIGNLLVVAAHYRNRQLLACCH
jgi:MerC mercury resistance protein